MKMSTSVFLCILLFVFSIHSHGVILHSFSSHLAGLELNDVCITPDLIRSKNTISVCSLLVPIVVNRGTESEYTSWICKKYETKKIILPRTIQKFTCSGFKSTAPAETDPHSIHCTRFKSELSFLPGTIKTREDITNGDYNYTVWGSHTFPDCN